MNNKRFTYLLLCAFIAGAMVLLFIQYNSSRNIDKLIKGNENLLHELQIGNHLRELELDIIWIESKIRAAIATDDTSHIDGVDAKMKEVDSYVNSLKAVSDDDSADIYIERLKYLAGQKLKAKNQLMHEFFKTGRMDDTSLIANPRAREISNEISFITRRIYDSRQSVMTSLSESISDSSKKARNWSIVLMAVSLLMGGGLFWFILSRSRQQQLLIQELDASEKRVRETARVKENFLANMSHEIRTPLNAILGFTNLLKSKKLDKDVNEFVGAIQKSGESLLTIINDILDLSKIEAGMIRIEANPFSVRGLLHSIQTLFSEKVREKGLTLEGSIQEGLPDTLVGDATRLTQILVNLIGNGLKFTEKGGIMVHITGVKTEQVVQLSFAITDTGIGIEKNKLESIFDRFHQAEDSITRKYGGTGLGLSIVKDLVLLQGGNIEVTSEPGKGTTFYFSIPYTIAPRQVPVPELAGAVKFTGTGSREIRILVVDDNEMNRSLMKHLFTEWKVAFDLATNGAEAITCLKQTHYDLVLMDIQMPEMDGYTATRFIRSELQLHLPVIAMTAHALAGERERCLSSGMDEYISKPINERELYLLLNRFTSMGQVREEAVTATVTETAYRCISLEYMREISRGNRIYEKKVTRQFIDAIPEELLLLQEAIERKDVKAVNALSHNLKTTVSIMGLTESLSIYLDEMERARDINTMVTTLFSALQNTLQEAVKEAEHFYTQV